MFQDLFATFSNLLNDSNSISYQVDDYGYDYGSDYDYYYYEVRMLHLLYKNL